MANNILTTIINAAIALNLPRIECGQEHYTLLIKDGQGWVDLAKVKTEQQIWEVNNSIRHLIPKNAEVIATHTS